MPNTRESPKNAPPNIVHWLVRTAVFCVFYAGQSVIINFSQFLGLLIWPFSKAYYQSYILQTQKSYGVLLMAINQFFAPSNFVITTDESAKDVLRTMWINGTKLELNIPSRIMLIANHQGMQFFQFIFLKRNWTEDKENMDKTLTKIANSKDPLWLLIFPEGTLVSEITRKTSKNYADKNGLVDPKFVLLPRSTGLHFCSSKLQKSVDYIYDLTIGLEGVKPGEYPEDIYTLRRIYFEGLYPPNIHIHIRRYRLCDLPSDEDKFAEWLRARWNEKDMLMTEFYLNGRFTSIYGRPKVIASRLNTVFELCQIWYFIVPSLVLWYLVNTCGVALPKIP
ncbi:12481_t:CDS:2 [Ambispora leptoticha]|uniref:12481_t:CDS:1 n=1 Tax=Ambispora leptoticha TaxID=144679 RepID=A0A9N8YPM0_9GLOM|nr:12481_t:CDS:2 [Ambispora leptoticha]